MSLEKLQTNKNKQLLGECIAEFIGTGLLIFLRRVVAGFSVNWS